MQHKQPQNKISLVSSGNPAHLNKQMTDVLQRFINVVATQGYKFTAITPLTHARYLSRSSGIAKNLRDVFGWSLPCKADVLPPLILELMETAGLLTVDKLLVKSTVRVSSLENDLFLHSAFPTDDTNSVFFGPDTYRFARFIKQSLTLMQFKSNFLVSDQQLRILDVGCGTGAGGVAAIRALPNKQPYQLSLNDINEVALSYAAANTKAGGINSTILFGDFFNISHQQQYDLIVSNPPYIIDIESRLYRDGGDNLGLDLSIRIAKHALQLLAPGGHLLLYTGVAITHVSSSPLLAELAPQLSSGCYHWSYEEIDPDVFGEELDRAEYRSVERIAAIGLIVKRLT